MDATAARIAFIMYLRSLPVARRIEMARHDKGWTQRGLVAVLRDAGLRTSRTALARWEGGTHHPAPAARPVLARVLDVPEHDLFAPHP